MFMYLKPLISEVLFSNQLDYSGPQPFWDHGPVLWKMLFPETGGRGWLQDDSSALHFIYCALYSYCYYINFTSYDQALDPRGWGPLET